MRNFEKEQKDFRTEVELDQAWELIRRAVKPISETVRVPLAQTLNRVLAQDVSAGWDLPPFDRSPLDGYALRSADTAGASESAPVRLAVVDNIDAGHRGTVPVTEGTAVRLMTGAPIPEGADCVVPFERVIEEAEGERGAEIGIPRPLKRHQNYCFQGEDVKKGTVVLPAGTRIDSRSIGVLASCGLGRATVLREPRITVFSTGDELVPAGTPLGEGKIHDSNSLMMAFTLAELGFHPENLGPRPDDPELAARLIQKEADSGTDLVVTSGGVSAGDRDIFHDVFRLLGACPVFRRIRVKPGSPVMLWQLKKTFVAALSGNPFALYANLQMVVRPVLAALTGCSALLPRPGSAVMAADFTKKSGVRRLVRAALRDGKLLPPGGHSSGMIGNLPQSDVLIDIEAGSGGLSRGDRVRFWHV